MSYVADWCTLFIFNCLSEFEKMTESTRYAITIIYEVGWIKRDNWGFVRYLKSINFSLLYLFYEFKDKRNKKDEKVTTKSSWKRVTTNQWLGNISWYEYITTSCFYYFASVIIRILFVDNSNVQNCNAPLPRIRRRYGDVHTRGENTLPRTLSLSTVHSLHIYMSSSMI